MLFTRCSTCSFTLVRSYRLLPRTLNSLNADHFSSDVMQRAASYVVRMSRNRQRKSIKEAPTNTRLSPRRPVFLSRAEPEVDEGFMCYISVIIYLPQLYNRNRFTASTTWRPKRGHSTSLVVTVSFFHIFFEVPSKPTCLLPGADFTVRRMLSGLLVLKVLLFLCPQFSSGPKGRPSTVC